MTLVKWQTPRNLSNMETGFDRLLNDVFTGFNRVPNTFGESWSPRVDIAESKDNFSVAIELPGINKEDLSINVKDSVLTIKGEKKAEDQKEGVNYLRMERSYGEFERQFKLSKNIVMDQISAEYKNGVLSIVLPKAEEAKPKEIAVKIS
ncbi:MAG: Hsp20/alpha crystallin family protein [Deferribacteres bacterium]|nr:Hsp20/alpha crystallin family protein [candidate division KSB1 bacterium]MCB9502882.1 Hsp20/alpha crystallin family protein [Deferribacteres bacterium]